MPRDINGTINPARPATARPIAAVSRPQFGKSFDQVHVAIDIGDSHVDHAPAPSAETAQPAATVGGDAGVDQERLHIDLRRRHTVNHPTATAVARGGVSAAPGIDDQIPGENKFVRHDSGLAHRTADSAGTTVRSITRDDLQIVPQKNEIRERAARRARRVSHRRSPAAAQHQNVAVRG